MAKPARISGDGQMEVPELTSAATSPGEHGLLEALRRGDETAFSLLLERHYSAMLRLALAHVGSHALAEDVVQETWLAVLAGIHRFEARSSLRTWIFAILLNRARSVAVREARVVPFSQHLSRRHSSEPEWRARTARGRATMQAWAPDQREWREGESPEDWLLSRELRAELERAIAALPERQREIVVLRDLAGWTAAEVCNVLQLSETNQRVLLHRARRKVQAALERYLAEPDDEADRCLAQL